jgi:lysophospholipase L1-like esterase
VARIRSRWLLWRLPALVACGAAVVLAIGFWLGLRGTLGDPIGEPPPTPAPPAPISRKAEERILLVLGDSLSRGTGDESGRGFAVDTLEAWKKRGPAQLVNLGVNGAESADVLAVVEKPNVKSLAASADAILVSAGGNDLSHAVTRDLSSPIEAAARIEKARETYGANLRSILADLRQANPTCPIAVVGLYNPFGAPGPEGNLGRSVLLEWIGSAERVALGFPDVRVIPTFDLFDGRPDRLAADRFHPNRKGYGLIADRILEVLPEN